MGVELFADLRDAQTSHRPVQALVVDVKASQYNIGCAMTFSEQEQAECLGSRDGDETAKQEKGLLQS